MSLKATEARIDRGEIKRTFNSPHKIECSDGETYVVKPRRSDRQFANEVIAATIGNLLGLPMPPAALVSVDQAFRDASPTAAAKYASGIHFATQFFAKSWTFENPAPALARSEIRNIDDLYRLVLFDETVANVDRRTNLGNNMVVQAAEASPRYRYIAIDHGHILTGERWTVDTLNGFGLAPIVPIFAFVETCLTSKLQLDEAARSIAAFSARFEEALREAKADLADGEKEAVVVFLTERAARLPEWVDGPQYASALRSLQP